MKKLLKGTGITLGVLFVALLTIPFLFQGKIKELIKTEANKMLEAQVDFKDLNLSLLRNFPNATVSLNDFSIVGLNDFEGDTLVYLQQAKATLNVMSLFKDSGYEIKTISLINGSVYAKVLEDGKANWDIMRDEEETESAEEETSDFKVLLQKVSVSGLDVNYTDLESDMKAVIRNFSGSMKGDMTAEITSMETQSSIEELSVSMMNIPFLSRVKVQAYLAMEANFTEQKYSFTNSNLSINAVQATVDGWVAMPDTSVLDMDIKLEAPSVDFKNILSLVPALYAADFTNLQAEGKVKLTAFAKGRMEGDSYPAFELLLGVADGMFRYPSLPKSVDKVQLDARVSSPGGSLNKVVVDLSKLHFNLGGNPFNLSLHASQLLADMNVKLAADGILNLGMIKEVYPLEKGTDLQGVLTADMSFAGSMLTVEQGKYEQVQAAGNMRLQNFTFKEEDIPEVLISDAAFSFNPRYAELSQSTVLIGKNDISAAGKLENYLPYIMKNQTLKGSLSLQSTYLNLNDFLEEDANAAAAEETPLLAFEIPKNLDLSLQAALKEVVYDNINMKNLRGSILVKDGKAEMNKVSMEALGGEMSLNGYYSTAKDPKKPEVNFAIGLKEVSYAETFKSFGFVKQLVPIFENMLGNYSVDFALNTSLDEQMNPILSSLVGGGTLLSKDVTIGNVPALTAVATALKNDKLKTISAKDLSIPFHIEDGRVNTNPFNLHVAGTSMNISGSTGLDQTIDYQAVVSLPSSLTNGLAEKVVLKIGGTFTSPKVSIDTKSLLESAASSALNKLGVTGGKSTDELKESAAAEVAKGVETLRSEARKAGEKLVEEAEKQGQNLIDEASKTKNPLAKAAAVTAAKSAAAKLKEEAQKKANQLNEEAEKKIAEQGVSSGQ